MSAIDKLKSFGKYINIFGDTNETINAIQKYIEVNNEVKDNIEEEPAASINRVINSTSCEETSSEIQKIINNM